MGAESCGPPAGPGRGDRRGSGETSSDLVAAVSARPDARRPARGADVPDVVRQRRPHSGRAPVHCGAAIGQSGNCKSFVVF